MPWLLDPAVDFVLAGLFLALVCFGVVFLIRAIGNILPTIPLIFTSLNLGKIFINATSGIVSWLTGFAQSRVWAVENWFRGIAYDLSTLFNSTIGAIYAHSTQIEHIWKVGLPDFAKASVNTSDAHAAYQLQLVRTEIHAGQVKWENAHSYADAVNYINLQVSAPSIEHAYLAGLARTLIATENHAQDLHDQLRDYIGKNITGQADAALPYTGQTITGISGAIAIPCPVDLGSVDVQDIIKTGSQIAVGTAVAIIATKIVECLVSNCSGNNNFGNLLQDALGLVSLAEFAEFVEAVTKDPGSVVAEYESDVEKFVPTTFKGIDDVWTAIEGALGL